MKLGLKKGKFIAWGVANLVAASLGSSIPSFSATPKSIAERWARATPGTDQKDSFQCFLLALTNHMDMLATMESGGVPRKNSARFPLYWKTHDEMVDLVMRAEFKTSLQQLSEGGPFEEVYYTQGGLAIDAFRTYLRRGAVREEDYPGFFAKDEVMFRALNGVIRSFHAELLLGTWHPSHENAAERVSLAVREKLNEFFGGAPPTEIDVPGMGRVTPREYLARVLPSLKDAMTPESPAEGLALTPQPFGVRPRMVELHYFPELPGVPIPEGISKGFGVTEDPDIFTTTERDAEGRPARIMKVLESILRKNKELEEAGEPPEKMTRVMVLYKVPPHWNTQKDGKIGLAVHGTPPFDFRRNPDEAERRLAEIWADPETLDHYTDGIQGAWTTGRGIKGVWDEKDQLVRILVENSWGTDDHQGFHWMQADYFPLIEGIAGINLDIHWDQHFQGP